MSDESWLVRLSERASADFHDILEWTARRFGERQARAYETVLIDAIARLRGGPEVLGARARAEIAPGRQTFHLSRPGRHIVVFHVADRQNREIDVLRILHESMDIPRHLPPGGEEND